MVQQMLDKTIEIILFLNREATKPSTISYCDQIQGFGFFFFKC